MATIRYNGDCSNLRESRCSALSAVEGVQDLSTDADKGGIKKAAYGREAMGDRKCKKIIRQVMGDRL